MGIIMCSAGYYALEVGDCLLAKGKLRGEGVVHVEGKWCIAGGLECLDAEAHDRSGASLDCFKENMRL